MSYSLREEALEKENKELRELLKEACGMISSLDEVGKALYPMVKLCGTKGDVFLSRPEIKEVLNE